MNKHKEPIRRGDIYWVRFGKTVGTEIRDPHPGVVFSNNWQNEKGSRVVVLPMSSKVDKIYPFEVEIVCERQKSKILTDQIYTIDKSRLERKMGEFNEKELKVLAKALHIVFELNSQFGENYLNY